LQATKKPLQLLTTRPCNSLLQADIAPLQDDIAPLRKELTLLRDKSTPLQGEITRGTVGALAR
jgi:hypothetical protein